jgi:CheY-like chemotaxis protein
MPAAGHLRVLVIDDNKDAADSFARLVEHWGYGVQIAYDSRSAVDKARLFKPNAVLLDIGLPNASGIDLARTFCQLEECKAALIVAMTGYHDEACRLLAKEAGINHYLVKPADADALAERLAVSCGPKVDFRSVAVGDRQSDDELASFVRAIAPSLHPVAQETQGDCAWQCHHLPGNAIGSVAYSPPFDATERRLLQPSARDGQE